MFFISFTLEINNFQIAHSTDCGGCYGDILTAVNDCMHTDETGWLKCVQDILGAANPCIDCICDVIHDVCQLFGCNFGC